MMRKALVLGASGAMGYAITKELCNRGIDVVAFARNKEKLENLFQGEEHIQTVAGDVFVKEDIIDAAKGVDVIFHAVNIPYSDWEKKQHKLLRNILEVAKESDSKLGIVDNIYAYGRQNQRLVKEDAEKNPHTKKGKYDYNLKRWQSRVASKCLLLIFLIFTVQMRKAHLFIILYMAYLQIKCLALLEIRELHASIFLRPMAQKRWLN